MNTNDLQYFGAIKCSNSPLEGDGPEFKKITSNIELQIMIF